MRDAFGILFLAFAVTGCSTESTTSSATPARESESVATPSAIPDAEGFVPITTDDLELFVTEKDAANVALGGDGELLTLTGTGRGYAHTRKPYADFTLRFEVRWPTAANLPEEERPNANTGVLVFITGEHKVWPKCLEVQGKWSELCHIKSNAKDVTVDVRDDEAARQQARKPVGEWNSVEIVSKDGTLTSYLNGTKIAESAPTELREGPIGFQAERFDVEFRNVRIKDQ